MKKIVLLNGLISGLIVTGFMVYGTLTCYNDPENFEPNMVLGYLGFLLAFSFVFIGIRQYRNKINGGSITFGKGFLIGLYISLIASTMYVVAWCIEFYTYMPDFMERYADYMIKTAQEKGASAAEIEAQKAEIAGYASMYKTPIGVVLLTYFEILPIGILISLISAAILRKKKIS